MNVVQTYAVTSNVYVSCVLRQAAIMMRLVDVSRLDAMMLTHIAALRKALATLS